MPDTLFLVPTHAGYQQYCLDNEHVHHDIEAGSLDPQDLELLVESGESLSVELIVVNHMSRNTVYKLLTKNLMRRAIHWAAEQEAGYVTYLSEPDLSSLDMGMLVQTMSSNPKNIRQPGPRSMTIRASATAYLMQAKK